MRYCIFGGSFDPPHQGHKYLAESAIKTLELDTIFWVPSPNPPHKQKPRTDLQDRIEMVKLLIQNQSQQVVSDIEKSLPSPSYSLHTIHALQKKYGPEHTWFFLIGADNWKIFPTWYKPEEVLKALTLVVFPREGVEIGVLPSGVQKLTMPEMDLRSSHIRETLTKGLSFDDANVPEEIRTYILDHHLYGFKN